MTRRRKMMFGMLVLLPALGVAGGWIAAATTPRPTPLGAPDGNLAACPPTPNCVSSQASDEMHAIAPIPYAQSLAEARARILDLLQATPRTTIIRNEPTYIAAEARSAFFRFVDDVDIVFDDSAKLIHVRSAARLGKGDLNVNRKRMEELSQRFLADSQ